MYGSWFYHSSIRKILVLFGDMFNDIYVARRTTTGSLVNQKQVPLSYAPRQKFLARLQERPDLTADRVEITLPRMSYEISGSLAYASDRQLPAANSCRQVDQDGNVVQIWSPAPYNIPLELNIYSKNQDEAMQILEQILPFFKPTITRKYYPINGQEWIDTVTFVLNGVSLNDDFEGEFKDVRTIVYTLTFEAQMNIYGRADTPTNLIKTAIINYNKDSDTRLFQTVFEVNPRTAGPDDVYVIDESTFFFDDEWEPLP